MPHTPEAWAPEPPSSGNRNVKLSEVIAKRIAEDIVSRGLEPGCRLPGERQMLERFEVSRGTLREALRILEVHGLLVIRSGPQGGPTVAQMTAADFNRACSLHFMANGITLTQLWEARCALEPTLARMAATSLTSAGREAFGELQRTDADEVGTSLETYVRVGSGFHRLIAQASDNPILSLFARSLGEMTASLESRNVYPQSDHKRVHQAHLDIVDAILTGDPDKAESLAAEHMEDMKETHSARFPGLVDNVLPYVI